MRGEKREERREKDSEQNRENEENGKDKRRAKKLKNEHKINQKKKKKKQEGEVELFGEKTFFIEQQFIEFIGDVHPVGAPELKLHCRHDKSLNRFIPIRLIGEGELRWIELPCIADGFVVNRFLFLPVRA